MDRLTPTTSAGPVAIRTGPAYHGGMTKPAKKEPRQVPSWVNPLTALAMGLGMLTHLQWLTVAAGVVAIVWLVQYVRWTNWDVARRAAEMREAGDER